MGPRREPVTFLGVVAVPVPRVLSEQLGLPQGFGLVVDSVIPDSPAAAVGLQPYDVLQMFNDQKLVGTEQLGTLVRGTPEGASVNLTFLRRGQPQTLSAKLVRRAPPEGPGRGMHDQNWMKFMPESLFGDRPGSPGGRRRVIIRHGDQGDTHMSAIDGREVKMVWKDDSGEVEVLRKGGKREVTVRNPKGEVIFSGPVETEEDRKKLAPEVLRKLDRLGREQRPGSPPSGRRETRDDDEEADEDFTFEEGSSVPAPPRPPAAPFF
jgi:serine protease Do